MNEELRRGLTARVPIHKLEDRTIAERTDDVATEEPLEIRLAGGGGTESLAVTMRTPGNDFELAAGFLFSEGIITSADDIATISYCIDPDVDALQQYNIVNVELRAERRTGHERLQRHFIMNSACGVCGKATIESLQMRAAPIVDHVQIDPAIVLRLPETMRRAQRIFSSTGGLHACALFKSDGTLIALREDVGRHNALDKLIGWAALNRRTPLRGCIALVSGRASFELVQKCVVAAIPVLCAVSAPSSLAVDLANAFGITLAGFVREGRANVYSAVNRFRANG